MSKISKQKGRKSARFFLFFKPQRLGKLETNTARGHKWTGLERGLSVGIKIKVIARDAKIDIRWRER